MGLSYRGDRFSPGPGTDELGRVVRTLFLLRYVSEGDVRQSIRAATSKIGACNEFLDWIGCGGSVLKSGYPVA